MPTSRAELSQARGGEPSLADERQGGVEQLPAGLFLALRPRPIRRRPFGGRPFPCDGSHVDIPGLLGANLQCTVVHSNLNTPQPPPPNGRPLRASARTTAPPHGRLPCRGGSHLAARRRPLRRAGGARLGDRPTCGPGSLGVRRQTADTVTLTPAPQPATGPATRPASTCCSPSRSTASATPAASRCRPRPTTTAPSSSPARPDPTSVVSQPPPRPRRRRRRRRAEPGRRATSCCPPSGPGDWRCSSAAAAASPRCSSMLRTLARRGPRRPTSPSCTTRRSGDRRPLRATSCARSSARPGVRRRRA